MKHIPVSAVLTEFGSKAKKKEPQQELTRRFAKPVAAPAEPHKPLPPVEKIPTFTDDGYERGLEEGKAAGRAEMEAQLEEQRRFLEKQHELERLTWASRETAALAARLEDGLRSLETAVAETVARILKPFLMERVRDQAIASMTRTLETLLIKGEGINLEISGPEDLLQLLREKLAIQGIKAVFIPGGGPDLRVTVGQTVIETRLAAWMSKFEEVVNE